MVKITRITVFPTDPDIRPEQPVDDESLGIPASDGMFPDGLAPRHQAVEGVVAGLEDLDDLDQLHDRDWVEEMKPPAPVSPPNILHWMVRRELGQLRSANLHHVSNLEEGSVGGKNISPP